MRCRWWAATSPAVEPAERMPVLPEFAPRRSQDVEVHVQLTVDDACRCEQARKLVVCHTQLLLVAELSEPRATLVTRVSPPPRNGITELIAEQIANSDSRARTADGSGAGNPPPELRGVQRSPVRRHPARAERKQRKPCSFFIVIFMRMCTTKRQRSETKR